MARSFHTDIYIRFNRDGSRDDKGSCVSGHPNYYASKCIKTGPYLIDENCSVNFMARSLDALILGISKMPGQKVVAKSWMGEVGASLPARTFQANLQKWETESKRTRNPVLGIGFLPGFGVAKRLLAKVQQHYVLNLTTSTRNLAGYPIALSARTASGGIEGADGVANILCSDLAAILQSEIRRPEFRGTKLR